MSSFGRVRSHKNGSIRVLTPDKSNKGYHEYRLSSSGVIRKVRVHRLVAEVFIGPPPDSLSHAAHKDGDRDNNAVGNIKWATGIENESDKIDHGTRVAGSKSHLAKLTEREAREAISMWESGDYSLRQIGEHFGVTKQAIWNIKERRSWSYALSNPSILTVHEETK